MRWCHEEGVKASKRVMRMMVVVMRGKRVVVMGVGMRMMREYPRRGEHLQKLNQGDWQKEGQNERIQEAKILAQQPAGLLEYRRRTPSS